MFEMHLVWPPERAGALDDQQLEQLYAYPTSGPAGKWLVVNYVASADGAVELGGRARQLSNPPDRQILQLGSDLADVLLVGASTAMIEEFRGVHPSASTLRRRRRHGLSDIPPTAVVTTGSLPADAPVITEAKTPTLVLTCAAAPVEQRQRWVEAGAEVVLAGGDTVDLAAAVHALLQRGLFSIDCEGGPHLFGSLLEAGVADELRLTVSPLVVAGSAGRIAASALPLDTPAPLELVSALTADDVLLLRYLVSSASV